VGIVYFSVVAFASFDARNTIPSLSATEKRFSCATNNSRSGKPPLSVHQLMPGDVDVIAALGDSLTAANGAKARTIIGLLLEDRGISWSIGSESSDITKLITLPSISKQQVDYIYKTITYKIFQDILRQNNPNIYGYSTGTGGVDNYLAGLNLGFPGDTSL
jgi:hypothetical protein